jgi:glyoxylase-like metal-dependent hydrolase (beta-lactamase superfamily II)
MIELVLPGIYRIEIPLPQNPLKATNAYFIKGKDRSLLVDTGFNQPECKAAMDQAIQDLGIDLANTDIFITHVHGDHSGLANYLKRSENTIYTGEYTANSLKREKGTGGLKSYYADLLEQSGLPPYSLDIHPGYAYASDQVREVSTVKDGNVLLVGQYSLKCLETSGHAPDHFCLYAEEQGLLFSGDHILGKITPNNTVWSPPWTAERDYLGEYLHSLAKMASLDLKLVLPGHRHVLANGHQRIQELKNHHQRRLEAILQILKQGSMSGAQVASQMKWDLSIKSWDDFPPAQKVFATGEALAHLTHLCFQKVVTKALVDGVVYYSLVD